MITLKELVAKFDEDKENMLLEDFKLERNVREVFIRKAFTCSEKVSGTRFKVYTFGREFFVQPRLTLFRLNLGDGWRWGNRLSNVCLIS